MRNYSNSYEYTEKQETPKIVLDHLNSKNKTIVNNYRTADNKNIEHCGWIAFEIAELLIKSGKKPYIVQIKEDMKDGHLKELYPLIYNKKVLRFNHQICCCDEMAYDPILNQPIKINEYCKTVFGEDISMKILYSQEKTEEEIKRKSFF